MNSKAFSLIVAAVVFAAIAAGLLTINGPFEARRDKFDKLRYQELTRLAKYLDCKNKRVVRPVLPSELSIYAFKSYCGGITIGAGDLKDNETGANYLYERKSDDAFSLCAQFYNANKVMRLRNAYGPIRQGFSFDPQSGCVSGRIR